MRKAKDGNYPGQEELLVQARGIALWLPGGSNLEPLLKIKKDVGDMNFIFSAL